MAIVERFQGGTVLFKKGKFGNAGRNAGTVDVGLKSIRPANEYWFDYWFRATRPWIDGLGGKLPGLAGGLASSGGADVEPDGWSSRIMWGDQGGLREYRYDQTRQNRWGDSYPWKISKFAPGEWHRVTQHVRVNTPGVADGAVQFWFNEGLVWEDEAVRWRGNVNADVALVDKVRISIFRGGGSDAWSVPQDTEMAFSDFYVLNCMPDLSVGSHDTMPVCKGEVEPVLVASIKLEPGTTARVDGDTIMLFKE